MCQFYSIDSIGRFANHLNVIFLREQRTQPFTYNRMVINIAANPILALPLLPFRASTAPFTLTSFLTNKHNSMLSFSS